MKKLARKNPTEVARIKKIKDKKIWISLMLNQPSHKKYDVPSPGASRTQKNKSTSHFVDPAQVPMPT